MQIIAAERDAEDPGELLEGPRWLDLGVPPDTLPVYVRDDSLLPMVPESRYIGERPWKPLELAVRVSSEASLRVEGDGAHVEVKARRDGDGLTIDLAGEAELTLRFVAPKLAEFQLDGDVTSVREERSPDGLTVMLSLDGSASLRGR